MIIGVYKQVKCIYLVLKTTFLRVVIFSSRQKEYFVRLRNFWGNSIFWELKTVLKVSALLSFTLMFTNTVECQRISASVERIRNTAFFVVGNLFLLS